MSQMIGIVRLAPGEVGFYDEISRIHLTISRPQAEVYDYMNTSKLVRAVRNKVLILVEGSLNAVKVINEEPVVKEKKVSAPAIKKEKAEVLVETETVAEKEELTKTLIEETIATEEVVEAIQEEVIEIKQPKKKATKKKK